MAEKGTCVEPYSGAWQVGWSPKGWKTFGVGLPRPSPGGNRSEGCPKRGKPYKISFFHLRFRSFRGMILWEKNKWKASRFSLFSTRKWKNEKWEHGSSHLRKKELAIVLGRTSYSWRYTLKCWNKKKHYQKRKEKGRPIAGKLDFKTSSSTLQILSEKDEKVVDQIRNKDEGALIISGVKIFYFK